MFTVCMKGGPFVVSENAFRTPNVTSLNKPLLKTSAPATRRKLLYFPRGLTGLSFAGNSFALDCRGYLYAHMADT